MKHLVLRYLLMVSALGPLSLPGLVHGQGDSVSRSIESKNYSTSTLMWYRQEAAKWEEALPVGNGRLGAMVYGRTGEETIQLNEDTYWTGGPYSTVVKGGAAALAEIQSLVFEEQMMKAHNLFGRKLMGYPVEQQKYQCLGNLVLLFNNPASPTGYKRWLDLSTGITGIDYQSGGIRYHREIFSSVPDQVIVIRRAPSDFPPTSGDPAIRPIPIMPPIIFIWTVTVMMR